MCGSVVFAEAFQSTDRVKRSMPTNKERGAAKRRPRAVPHFAKLLVDLMKEKNMTVRSAATVAGVGASTIVSWRSGALPEDYRAVKALAQALGVSFSFLLTGEEDDRGTDAPSMTEVFQDGGSLFDGYAKISIQRLIPRKKEEK